MTSGMDRRLLKERLRASPNFALAFGFDGRPYVAKETEPYSQYWLSEHDRILLSMFSRRGGTSVAEALDGYLRLTRARRSRALYGRLSKTIGAMRHAGVLVGLRDDSSRYGSGIVDSYLRHRPFPADLVDFIVGRAAITSSTRVLDIAGGPGDLALGLARASDHVSLMELSRGFLNAASRQAKASGLALVPLHDSGNRLMFRDEPYDVITISQALHWLDDVLVCRGVCRLLQPGGSFFVIHSAIRIEDDHPLGSILGYNSILGAKKKRPFADEVEPLLGRLSLLFDALDAPDVQRLDLGQRWEAGADAAFRQIVPSGVSLFRQSRPFDMGYLRGFLTSQHVASTGRSLESILEDLDARCAAAAPEEMIGIHDWAVLQFTRGGARFRRSALRTAVTTEIAYRQGRP